MSNPTRLKAYGQNTPLVDVFPFPLLRNRAPTGDDRGFEIGQEWIYRSGDTVTVYIYGGVSSANQGLWPESSTTAGNLNTLEADTGGLISPISQNITLAGGTNINTAGTAGTITINLATDINVTSATIGAINIATHIITATTTNSNIRLVPNGTGKVTFEYATQNAVPIFGNSGALNELGPLTNGQIVIGSTGSAPVAAAITSTGGTITVTNGAGSINLEAVGDSSFPWSVETSTTSSPFADTGIFANNASGVTFTLPAVVAVGDTFRFQSMNAGGFTVAYNAGQSIRLGTSVSTTSSGSIVSTAIGDAIEIICNVANTGFLATATQGNFTIN